MPVQTLLEYLERGQSVGEFLSDFPTVTQEQAIAALQEAREALLDAALEYTPQFYTPGRGARAARHVVTPYHCRQYFADAGYGNSSTFRD